jgi:hypothetical protein
MQTRSDDRLAAEPWISWVGQGLWAKAAADKEMNNTLASTVKRDILIFLQVD